MVYNIELNGWRLGIFFSACHLLFGMNKCSRLHGHTYAIHVKICGAKDELGMVLDFIKVKQALKEIIKNLDHRVLLPKSYVKQEAGKIKIIVNTKEYIFPSEDVVLLELEHVTAENLAAYLLEKFIKELKLESKRKTITELELGLDEGWGQGVWVRKKL
jgi:6-pyruvoyltetrahydropterin/6-carboxytetrahydropterin synthase